MDLNTFLAILTIIGIPFSFWCGWYFSNRKKKQFQKRDELQAEANYLKTIREKPIELIRHAFSKLFLLLFLLVLGIFIPVLFEFVEYNRNIILPNEAINAFQFVILSCCTAISFWTFKVFSNVVNYDRAINKIENKLAKVNKKIEHS